MRAFDGRRDGVKRETSAKKPRKDQSGVRYALKSSCLADSRNAPQRSALPPPLSLPLHFDKVLNSHAINSNAVIE